METTPGKRVQLLREAKGYKSLTGFAEFTGIKVGTISALEADRSAPSLETLAKLRRAFPDLNMDWLIDEAGPMLRDGRALVPLPVAPQPVAPAAESLPLTQVMAIAKERDTMHNAREASHRAEVAELRREGKERVRELVLQQQSMGRLLQATIESKERDLAFARAEIERLRARLHYAEGRAGLRELTPEEQARLYGPATPATPIGFHREWAMDGPGDPQGDCRMLVFSRPLAECPAEELLAA